MNCIQTAIFNDKFAIIWYNFTVYIENLGEIKAIAFDIDGTLYRNSSLYSRLVFHFVFNFSLFRKFNAVRKEMHTITEPLPNFKDVQAQKMADRLGSSKENAYMAIDRISYGGLIKYFERIKPCKGVVQFIKNIKEHNLKIGILSDFPPEQKGELWGILPYCDVILGTEEVGILKPAAYPFQLLSQELGVKPEEILYVGNSHKYDVEGARNAGMKAAWFIPCITGVLGKKSREADITFWSYKKLNKHLFDS